MKVRIIGNVEHDGAILEEYEVYDLNDTDAKALIAAGNAKEVKDNFPKDKVSTYVPQAVARDEKTGITKPGQKVAAIEPDNPNPSAVKAVEPASKTDVKGDDKSGKK